MADVVRASVQLLVIVDNVAFVTDPVAHTQLAFPPAGSE